MSNVNGSFLDKNGLTYLWGKLKVLLAGKADASSTVSNVAWDSTNNKITKTINSSTTDVVTAAALKTAMELKFSDIGNTPTTLLGYGIDDAKITSGTITLGSNSITPLVSDDVYGRGTALSASSSSPIDLDDYLAKDKVGLYYTTGNAVTKWIDNCPYKLGAIRLVVEYSGAGSGSDATITQTVYPEHLYTSNADSNANVRFFRRVASLETPKKITDWIEFNGSLATRANAVLDALDTGVVLTADSHIDDITIGGSYSCNSADNVATPMNTYQINNNLAPLPYVGQFKLMVFGQNSTGTSTARAIQILIPSTTSAYMFMRVRNGSSWCAWGRIDSTYSARQSISNDTDILTLSPGRYYKPSNAGTRIVHMPSDWGSVKGCLVDVDCATALARRIIKLYPVSDTLDEVNYYYIRMEGPNGFDKWVKYTGTFITYAT